MSMRLWVATTLMATVPMFGVADATAVARHATTLVHETLSRDVPHAQYTGFYMPAMSRRPNTSSRPDVDRLSASMWRPVPVEIPLSSSAQITRVVSINGRPASREENSSEPSASVLDIGLMLLFGAGMMGYQLLRKQRTLRHSSLLTA